MNTNSTQTASFFKNGQLQDFYGILNYDLTKEPTPIPTVVDTKPSDHIDPRFGIMSYPH